MGVKVAFLGKDEPGQAAAPRELLVPKNAVRKDGDRDVVFVVAGERAERRAVQTRPAPGDDVAVTSGLSPGERVVVEAPAELKDGDRIAVKDSQAE
jgi:multidrug efflux pump subunit AcrA (membrane-fusion protein)